MDHTTVGHYLLCLTSTVLEDYQYLQGLGGSLELIFRFKTHFWISFLHHRTAILIQSSYKQFIFLQGHLQHPFILVDSSLAVFVYFINSYFNVFSSTYQFA